MGVCYLVESSDDIEVNIAAAQLRIEVNTAATSLYLLDLPPHFEVFRVEGARDKSAGSDSRNSSE
jgi:hypothetical protein